MALPVDERTRVYLNGERAAVSDLREGDRVRYRRFDRDGSGIARLWALRTDEFTATPSLEIHPDIDSRGGTGAAPAKCRVASPRASRPRTAAKPAARTPPASPGPRKRESPPRTAAGSKRSRRNCPAKPRERVARRRGRGVTVGAAGGSQSPGGELPPGEKRAPGFGFVVSDSPGEGVLVADVQPGGPAAEAGVRQGDFLTRMGGKSVESPGDVKELASRKTGDEGEPEPVPATLWRDGESQEVTITPSASARDYFPRSNRDAMSGSARSGFDPMIGARTRDSEDTGVEILAAAATGALAAEAGEDSDGYGPAYGGNPYGFYGDDFIDGVGPFDDGLYGGYGGYGYGGSAASGAVATAEAREQQLENVAIRRQLAERRAADAAGLDAEDYFSGSYTTEEGAKYRSVRPGDRIIGVNDRPISGRADLRRAVRGFTGNRLKLNVIRNGERTNLFLPKRVAATITE